MSKDAEKALREMQELLNYPSQEGFKQKFLDQFESLKGAMKIVDLDHAANGPLDYVAHIIYQYEGSTIRWGALRDDVKDQYRQKAIDTVASWATEEMEQKKLADMESVRLVPRKPS